MAVEEKGSDAVSHEDQPLVASHTAWIPVSLRRSTLLALAASAVLIALALASLKIVSDRNNGLCDARSRDHYVWQYAPVAVFTLFAAAWAQVEYRAKQVQPWRSMSKEAKKPSDGVLLDYLSPWNVIVLYRAVKRRHYVVLAAVGGSLILQLLIILSTSLLTLSNVEMHSLDADLVAVNRFVTNDGDLNLGGVDGLPAYLTVGISRGIIDLSPYTTNTAALQQVVPRDGHIEGIQSIKAEVEVLSSTVHCESATISFRRRTDYVYFENNPPWFATGFKSPSFGECIFPGWGNGPNYRTYNPMGDTYCYTHACGETLRCSVNQSSILEDAPRHALLMWFVVDDFDQTIPGTLCWPKYEFKKELVVFDGPATSNVSEIHDSKDWQVPSIKDNKVHNAFVDSMSVGRPGVSYILSPPQDFTVSRSTNEWLLMAMLNPQVSMKQFEDPQVVAQMFSESWSAFTAQLFNLYFTEEANLTIKGDIVTQRQRLVLRAVSFWLTESCLLVLFAISVALLLMMRSREDLKCDPSSIAGLASILATCPALMEQLHQTGIATEEQLADVLSDQHIGVTTESSAATTIYCAEPDLSTASRTAWLTNLKSKETHWYRPLSAKRIPSYALIFALAALILTLEVLLRESNERNGLAHVNKPQSYEHFAWSLLPALTMVCVTIVIGARHETVKMFAPYVSLSRGANSARATIMRRPFSTFSIRQTFQDREIYIVSSSMAIFVGWFLTIVVSGLYSSVNVPSVQQISVQQTDWFKTNLQYRRDFSPQAPFQIEMVLNGNSSYPKSTYETLALSKIQSPRAPIKGKLEVQALPALRSDMNCTIIPDGDMKVELTNVTGKNNPFEPFGKQRTLVVHLRNMPRCADFLAFSSVLEYSHPNNKTAELLIEVPTDGFFGGLLPDRGLSLHDTGPGSRCPGYIAAVGSVTQRKIESITVITCEPFAKKVFVDVTFDLQTMNIDLSSPPVVRNIATEPIEIGFGNKGAYNPFSPFQDLGGGVYWGDNTTLDLPMKILVNGSRGIPLPELVGRENRERFRTAVSHLYGLAFAQLMDGARLPTDASNSSSMQATISTPDGYRLKQSSTSTHVLSCLLAIIMVAVVVSTFSVSLGRVLPKNPCSIAAVASLLAGSDLLAMTKPDFQHLSERELADQFDGYTFSMGWWTGGEGDIGRRRFGIDFGRAEHLR